MTFTKNQPVYIIDRKCNITGEGVVSNVYADGETVGVLRNGGRFPNVLPSRYVMDKAEVLAAAATVQTARYL